MSTSDSCSAAPSLRGILRRFAFPLFLFSFALSGALLFSQLFILPRLTSVMVDGIPMNGGDLVRSYGDLRERVQRAEDFRNQLVLPGRDPLSRFLQGIRRSRYAVAALRAEVERVIAEVLPESSTAVVLTALSYDVSQETLLLTGSVRGVGVRSMTVLAQLVDAFSASPLIASVTPPRFLREQDARGEFSSPFTILVHLRTPSPLLL